MATGTLTARKNSDADIRALTSYEGTFRIDVTNTISTLYTVFYRLPKGAQYFDSACSASACPRIIISHSYPYVWESNCKGTTQGYHIVACHSVFDGHDNRECGTVWKSSKYPDHRVLYRYCGHNGIFSGKQGHVYVR
ncbi:uncharacterized protein LOC110243304 [Exaiptasia diaphana]|uniref:Uncharacterized protein n=1 Tax=Exaiptasia diaphana TaxID=2652724 RepID=A0A913XHX4_EXADI|nr:uncharacterized protein LOC110243304 [Exaiptasia diaphana]